MSSQASLPFTGTERITAALGDIEHSWITTLDNMATIEIASEQAHAVLSALKNDAQFEANTLVTAIDHFPAEPRFQMVWQLLSLQHNERIRVYAKLDSTEPSVGTCIDLWPGAAFGERECYDMFGIHFEGHNNLRRLLMPDGYDHHPLRKDFPHQGIQPDRLYREWDDERRSKWEADEKGGQA
ncbi:MAG: NADH:ubiquinone oxidoreductase subunit C [Planctomycetota bacterium]|jgi:NADH:ubiquinone oxidoreductase subunit C